MKNMKKILALLLCLTMALGMFPAAFADDGIELARDDTLSVPGIEEVVGDDAVIVPENADPITNDDEAANPSDTSVGDDAYPQGTEPDVPQAEQAEGQTANTLVDPALIMEDVATFEAVNGGVITREQIEAAISYGESYKGIDSSIFYEKCAAFVFHCYHEGAGLANSSYSTATAMGNALIDHPNDQNAPRGAFIFWTVSGNSAGHVALSLGNGNIVHSWGKKPNCVVAGTIANVTKYYGSGSCRGWGPPIKGFMLETDPNYTTVTPTVAKTATYNNHIYERYDSSISWTDAKAFCESKGGHLVTINSKAENDWITNTLLKGCAKNIYFIGATDSGDNKWKWITGEAFAYTNWDADRPEPTNDSGEDYGAIMGKQVGNNKSPGEWIDIFNTGDTRYTGYSLSDCGFICEYESYTVTYNANGGTGAPGTQTKTHGVKLPLSSAKPSHANSSAGSYTVTLNANGGSVSKNSIDAARTTKYEFKTWNTKKDGSGTSYKPGADYTANAEVTLYAQWNTSTTTAAVTLPTPTREGYTFKGWGTSSNATSGVTGSYTPTGNVTLYAIWSVNKLALQYHTNGGSIGTNSYDFSNDQDGYILRSGNRTVSTWRYGNTYEDGLINNTTFGLSKPGYVFQGWRIGQGEDSIVYDQNLTLTPEKLCPELKNGDKTVTLYAVWEANKYTVTFDANGGTSAPGAQTKTHGTNLTLPSTTPTRASTSAGSHTVTLNANGGSVSPATLSAARTTSYTFKNWNTAANGSGTSYNPGASYSTDANVTLYAQWNSSTSTAAVTLPTPTRSGFIFKGWATSSGAASGVTGSYTPSGNVTLYAVWAGPDFVLPAALTTIDAEAFAGGAFSYVKLSDKTTSIGARAFADCPNLRYVYIPEATTGIAGDAFSGVSGLTILGRSGSYAEFFAQKNGYAFDAAE